MNKKEFDEILAYHTEWLKAGKSGVRANLRGANLRGATGNRREIKNILVFNEYPISYTKSIIQIGCQNYEIYEWRDFPDAVIHKMEGDRALSFWKRNKDIIFQIIDNNPAD